MVRIWKAFAQSTPTYGRLLRGGASWRTISSPAVDENPSHVHAVAAAAHADDPEAFFVLLGHRNDFYEKYPDLDADLVLCGHAHGGVVRLPFLGGVIGHGELFADNLAGIRRSGGYTLVISRGLGNGGVPIPRLLNNPEIVVITLRRA